MWGHGGADISSWIVGSVYTRGGTGAYTNTIPGITTAMANTLALAWSFEATLATETGDPTVSAPWQEVFYGAQSGSLIETIYTASFAPQIVGTITDATVTYQNSQINNGLGIMLGIPPITTGPAPTTGYTLWNGTSELPLVANIWDGNDEHSMADGVGVVVGQGRSWPEIIADTSKPVFVAHRGGSGSWPEETLLTYKESAVIWGMECIEISVQMSASGTFWCFHDATTDRTTGVSGTIATMTDAQLEVLSNVSSATDNPSQPAQPVAKLTDVLDIYGGKRVIFIEDKTYSHTTQLLNLMDSYGGPDWFIWKQDGTGTLFSALTQRGYKSWGYIFDSQMATYFASHQAQWTYIGLDYNSSDATLTSAIATAGANRVLVHIIPNLTQANRCLTFGVRGLMIAGVRSVVPHGISA